MNKLLGVCFALSCLATAMASSQLVGIGMWFYVILVAGFIVLIGQFVPQLTRISGLFATFMAIVAIAAVILTLLAATIGGSFSLDQQELGLVTGFTLIAIFGLILGRRIKKSRLVVPD